MDCRKMLTQSLFLGLLLIGQVLCYPNGAYYTACSSMVPDHQASASDTLAPYTITTSKRTYKPNEEITGSSHSYRKQREDHSDNDMEGPCRSSRNRGVSSQELTPDPSAPVTNSSGGGGEVTTASSGGKTTVPSGEQFLDPACGKTKGCFHDSTFLVTWADRGNSIDFEMKARIPYSDNYWMSLGFSSDRKMGDDSVADCSVQSGIVKAYSSYNPGRYNEPLDNNTFGIIGMGGNVENGVFTCSFSRAKTATNFPSTRRKKRATVSTTTFVDLNEDWYLLFAHGKGAATSKDKHIADPKVSEVKADLQSMKDLTAPDKVDLVKVHGSLMIVAWILLASIGIVMARFYKPVWPDSRLFGEKVWFQIHRACMVLVLFLVAASFIIIFIEVDGYSETDGWTDFHKAHPILGIIIMALTVINPVMALFRPHPDAPRRKIFNIAHFGVGTAAFILSIINIFIGVGLEMSKNVENVLWAYVGWFIFIVIVLELHDLIQSRKGKNGDSYELNITGKQPSGGSSMNPHKWKPWIIAFHVVIILGLTIALLVLGNLEMD